MASPWSCFRCGTTNAPASHRCLRCGSCAKVPEMSRLLAVLVVLSLAVCSGCAAIAKAVPLLDAGLSVIEFGQELVKDTKGSLEQIASSRLVAAFLADVVASETGQEPPAKAEGESQISFTFRLLQWVASYRYSELDEAGLIEEGEESVDTGGASGG